MMFLYEEALTHKHNWRRVKVDVFFEKEATNLQITNGRTVLSIFFLTTLLSNVNVKAWSENIFI